MRGIGQSGNEPSGRPTNQRPLPIITVDGGVSGEEFLFSPSLLLVDCFITVCLSEFEMRCRNEESDVKTRKDRKGAIEGETRVNKQQVARFNTVAVGPSYHSQHIFYFTAIMLPPSLQRVQVVQIGSREITPVIFAGKRVDFDFVTTAVRR